MTSYFWPTYLAIVSIVAGAGVIVLLLFKIVAQLSAERKIMSRVRVYEFEPMWPGGISDADEWTEYQRHRLVETAKSALSGIELNTVLDALNQPSRKGRMRYIAKLLRSGSHGTPYAERVS